MDIQKILNNLFHLGREILKQKDIQTLLLSIADITRNLLNADRCSIFIYDKENDVLYTKVAHGIDPIVIPKDKGIVGFTFSTGEVQIVFDAYEDRRFFPEIDKLTGYTTKSLITAPLIDSHNKIFGVVEVINKQTGFFSSLDAELLVLSSSYISSILENAFLNELIKESHTKVILKLSTAAEFKDEETSLHTKRVAIYSSIIAESMNLEKEFVSNITITAPMHDVGKIGIPDKILNKPGKLTKDEFEIIKTHPTIGFNILFDENSDLLKMAANISKDHHEKWNGTGYPDKLEKDNISLEGRIVAIADVFDALTSKRPYKAAWTFERALTLIKEESGKHFDPELTECFLNNENKIRDTYETYKE